MKLYLLGLIQFKGLLLALNKCLTYFQQNKVEDLNKEWNTVSLLLEELKRRPAFTSSGDRKCQIRIFIYY